MAIAVTRRREIEAQRNELSEQGFAEQLRNLSDLQETWRLNSGTRNAITLVLDMASGDQIRKIRKNSGESNKHFGDKPKFAANALGRIVAAKSFLYDSEPIRRFPDSDDSDATHEEWKRLMYDVGGRGSYNAHMDELDPVTWLCGVVIGWIQPSDDEEHGVEWTIRTRDMFEVLSTRDKPEVARAVIAEWYTEKTKEDKTTWMRYADDTYLAWVSISKRAGNTWKFEIDDDSGEVFIKHGLGQVPIEATRNWTGMHGTYESPRLGGRDAAENQRTLAHLSSEMPTAVIQSRGQKYVTGDFQADQKPVNSPEVIWKLKNGGQAGGINSGADLTGSESIYVLLQEANAMGMGVDPDVVRLKKSVVESGKAILVRRAAQLSIAKKRRRQGQDWEYRKHRLAAKQIKQQGGPDLDWKVVMEYPQGVPIITVDDRLKVAEFISSKGIADEAKVLSFLFDELPPDEIKRLLLDASKSAGSDPGDTPPPPPSVDIDEEFDDRTGPA